MSAPSLSEVRQWMPDYLDAAASHWEQTASAWSAAYDNAFAGARAPGGSEWAGRAADAAMERVAADRARIDAAVEDLRIAVGAARIAANDLASCRRDVVAAVAAAEAMAFVVDEDYSVRALPSILSPVAAVVRRLQAAACAATIRARVVALSSQDADAAEAILAAGRRLDDLRFESATAVPVQLVDFYGPLPQRPGRPNPSPEPPPDGWSNDPITRAAQHIAYGHATLKHLQTEWPAGTTTAALATEVERMMRAAANPNSGLILGRTGDGAAMIYDPKTNIVVIRDPRAADCGTVFKPRDGIDYLKTKLATRVPTIPPADLAAAPPRATPEPPKVEPPRPEPRVGLPRVFLPPRIVPGPSIGDGLPVIDADGVSYVGSR